MSCRRPWGRSASRPTAGGFAHSGAAEDLERMKKFHYTRRDNPDNTPNNYEFRLIDTRGKKHDIYITIGMIPNTRKSVASFLDITERKKAEQKVKESEEHFKSLFHQNSAVLMLLDPETGDIHDVNNKAVGFYG